MLWQAGRIPETQEAEGVIDLERGWERGRKFYFDIAELQAIAPKCRLKPKKLPRAPHADDIITESAPPVTGACRYTSRA
jgi:hypothetical protein